MAAFEYMVRDEGGLTRRDIIQAATRELALDALREQRMAIVFVREKRQLPLFSALRGRFERVDDKSLLMFTRQLATMVAAGMPIVGALAALARQGTNKRLSLIINLVRSEVEAGTYLSQAMKEFPDAFSDLYVGLIAVGEASGQLEGSLDRLASFLQRDFDLKRKVKAAITYPAFVLAVGIAVIWGLMSFVIPRFVELFQSGLSTEKMPAVTRVMITVSEIAGKPLTSVLLVLFATLAVVVYRRVYRSPGGRLAIDRFLLAVPALGTLLRTVALARMCRTLGTLLGAGVPILQGLEVLGRSVGNAAIEVLINSLRVNIMSGEPMAQAMSSTVLFPPLVVQMVRVGEATGTLDNMLNRVADFYDAEVEYALSSLAALIEPVMVVGLGGMVLFIVLAVMLPVLTLVQSQM